MARRQFSCVQGKFQYFIYISFFYYSKQPRNCVLCLIFQTQLLWGSTIKNKSHTLLFHSPVFWSSWLNYVKLMIFSRVKLGFQHPQTKYSVAFDLLVTAPLSACPYHPGTIGGWSLRATFTVQMLSFQWHFKQSLSIYSHSRFMSFDKMPL